MRSPFRFPQYAMKARDKYAPTFSRRAMTRTRDNRQAVLRSSRSYYANRAYYLDLFAERQRRDPAADRELDILEYAFRTHAQRRVRRVLDVACGGGRHVVGSSGRPVPRFELPRCEDPRSELHPPGRRPGYAARGFLRPGAGDDRQRRGIPAVLVPIPLARLELLGRPPSHPPIRNLASCRLAPNLRMHLCHIPEGLEIFRADC